MARSAERMSLLGRTPLMGGTLLLEGCRDRTSPGTKRAAALGSSGRWVRRCKVRERRGKRGRPPWRIPCGFIDAKGVDAGGGLSPLGGAGGQEMGSSAAVEVLWLFIGVRKEARKTIFLHLLLSLWKKRFNPREFDPLKISRPTCWPEGVITMNQGCARHKTLRVYHAAHPGRASPP
ncbi:hypothetical protein MLD38_035305 [Melastoma candidum]|uniref:Uncharacterized protein n=1 Tax=Melastoma candidum TaxID=119954 RepID=A0ACB9MCN9_9MYRT|nr:hypothetical protein MLD38_035305 [Melastoma candidum]